GNLWHGACKILPTMSGRREIKRVIWAVDPFEKDAPTFARMQKVFQDILNSTHAVIEPVYVMSPATFGLSIDYSPKWTESMRPAAREALGELLAELRGKLGFSHGERLLEPRILLQESASQRASVRTLTDYAAESFAQMIALGN